MSKKPVKAHLPSKNPKFTLCGYDAAAEPAPEGAERCKRCAAKDQGGTWTDPEARPLPNVTAAKHVWFPTA